MGHERDIEGEDHVEAMDWVGRYFVDIGDHGDYHALVHRTGDWLEALLGERIAGASMRALLVVLHAGMISQHEIESRVDRDGWRTVLDDSYSVADWPSIAGQREQLYAYAIDGVVIGGQLENDVSARRAYLEGLFAEAMRFIELFPEKWEPHQRRQWSITYTYLSALARWKLDRGEPLTVAEIARLARLDEKTVLNALGKQLHPSDLGLIAANEAHDWLMGRRPRKFRPSRWLDPDDDQYSRSPARAEKERDIVMVPVDAQGEPFLPTLARPTRGAGAGRLGFRVGAKGQEFVVYDYFEALDALKGMHPPRWRRPNAEGNWGIVRGEANWRAIPRCEIERLLADVGVPPAHSSGE